MTAIALPVLAYGELFKTLTADWKAGQRVWRETSEEVANDALCVLPPIYVPGGFMMGEPYSTDKKGRQVFAYFREVNGRHFAIYCSIYDVRAGELPAIEI